MKNKRFFTWDRPAGVLTIVIAAAMAGCGGQTPAPTKAADSTTTQDSTPTAATPKAAPNASLKGRRRGIQSDEDARGIRERRAQRLKEQNASKQ